MTEPADVVVVGMGVGGEGVAGGTLLAIYRPAGTSTCGEFQMEEGFRLPDS
jgi:hypothetical protein